MCRKNEPLWGDFAIMLGVVIIIEIDKCFCGKHFVEHLALGILFSIGQDVVIGKILPFNLVQIIAEIKTEFNFNQFVACVCVMIFVDGGYNDIHDEQILKVNFISSLVSSGSSSYSFAISCARLMISYSLASSLMGRLFSRLNSLTCPTTFLRR